MNIRSALYRIYSSVTHFIGRATKRYYFEDYMRVYPDAIRFNRFGIQQKATTKDINNYLNHRKFYEFAAQFASGKRVADVGCGSGYGCEILKRSGAALVFGSDISKASINFARSRYGNFAEFTVQGITNLHKYPGGYFDLTLSNEVLEHLKEYDMEEAALIELKRITRSGGLLIVATPNSELLGEHGFHFDEISALFERVFPRFCIFENALVPFGGAKLSWEKRLSEGRVGKIVSERIDLSETVLPMASRPELKKGIEAGKFKFANYDVDTTLLHNTHSWVVLATD